MSGLFDDVHFLIKEKKNGGKKKKEKPCSNSSQENGRDHMAEPAGRRIHSWHWLQKHVLARCNAAESSKAQVKVHRMPTALIFQMV